MLASAAHTSLAYLHSLLLAALKHGAGSQAAACSRPHFLQFSGCSLPFIKVIHLCGTWKGARHGSHSCFFLQQGHTHHLVGVGLQWCLHSLQGPSSGRWEEHQHPHMDSRHSLHTLWATAVGAQLTTFEQFCEHHIPSVKYLPAQKP